MVAVFRTLSNICDSIYFRKKYLRVIAINFFPSKGEFCFDFSLFDKLGRTYGRTI